MKTSLQFIGLDALNEWAKNNTRYLKDGEISVSNYDLERYNEYKSGRFSGLEIPGFSECILVIAVIAQTHVDPRTLQNEFEYYYVHNAFPALRVNNVLLTVYGNHNAKTFSFNLLDPIKHHYINNLSNYDQKDWPTPPKKVGKATKKSLQAWIDYLHEIEKLKQQIIDEKTAKVSAFLQSLQPYDKMIEWGKSRDSGSITRGGLKYTFEIYNTGYISQKWEKHYGSENNIETFMKASENLLR